MTHQEALKNIKLTRNEQKKRKETEGVTLSRMIFVVQLHELDVWSPAATAADVNATSNCTLPGPVPGAGPVTIADASVICARDLYIMVQLQESPYSSSESLESL